MEIDAVGTSIFNGSKLNLQRLYKISGREIQYIMEYGGKSFIDREALLLRY